MVLNRGASPSARLTRPEKLRLFGKRRIAELKAEKSASRIRRRSDPRKILYCKDSIREGYEKVPKVRDLLSVRTYDPQKDAKSKFRAVASVRHQVGREWFRDPTYVPDFQAIGWELASREDAFILSKIASSSNGTRLPEFDHFSLDHQIMDFAHEGTTPSSLFVSLALSEVMHNWRTPSQAPCLRYISRYSEFLLSDGSAVRVEFTRALENNQCIIYSKLSHGELVYEPGNFKGALSLSLAPSRKDRRIVNVHAHVSAAYCLKNREGGRLLLVSSPEQCTCGA